MEAMSWERIVPEKIDRAVSFQRNILEQHVARYEFASRLAHDRVVVDAACGAGYGSNILEIGGARSVFGLDVDPATIEYAQRTYGSTKTSFLVADLNRFNFATLQPSMVVSFETVEHLVDPEQFLRGIRANLPKHGILVASVPTAPLVDMDEFHLHDFTKSSWRSLVEKSGFTIIDELFQRYCATLKELKEEGEAKNTASGARKNLLGYYLKHPYSAIRRLIRMSLYGLELEMLTVVAVPRV